MEKQAFEPTGLIPQSIIRTVDRFVQQLLPGKEKIALQEYRVSRYQILVSIKSLLTLILIPLFLSSAIKALLLTPLIEHFWNSDQAEIFLNQYQEKRAFSEMHDFSEKMFFESLLLEPRSKPILIPNVSNAFLEMNPQSIVSLNSTPLPPQRAIYKPSFHFQGAQNEGQSIAQFCHFLGKAVPTDLFASLTELQNEEGMTVNKSSCVKVMPTAFGVKKLCYEKPTATVNLGGWGFAPQQSETLDPTSPFRERFARRGQLSFSDGGIIEQQVEPLFFTPDQVPLLVANELCSVHTNQRFVIPSSKDLHTNLLSFVHGKRASQTNQRFVNTCPSKIFFQNGALPFKGQRFVSQERQDLYLLSNSNKCNKICQEGQTGNLTSYEAQTQTCTPPHNIYNEATRKYVEDLSKESISTDEPKILQNESGYNGDRYQKLFQIKSLELAKSYNKQSILAITNLLGDFLTFLIVSLLFRVMRPELIILKSFLTESVYSLSDTTKSFLLILGMDLLVGFHSPRGWELALEGFLRHAGLPENENFVLLFVALFPVFLDTVFKYWIFRYLNKISPSTVVTYHTMIE